MSRKNSRKKKRPDALRQAKNALRGPRPRSALSQLRLILPVHQYEPLLRWISKRTFFSRAVFLYPLPSTYAQLGDLEPLSSIGLERELRWAGQYLSIFAEDLSRFVDLSGSFHRLLSANQLDSAGRILDEVERKVGVSNWLIRNRIALLQEAGGLEAQKNYFTRIREEAPRHSLAAFLAYNVSIRNEPTVSPSGFAAQLSRNMQRVIGAPEDALEFLQSELLPGGPLSAIGCEIALRYTQAMTAVDAYDGFIDVARSIVATGDVVSKSHLAAALRTVRAHLSDSRLEALALQVGLPGQPHLATSIESSRVLEDWLCGNHAAAAEGALEVAAESGRDPFLLDIAARARAIEEETIAGEEAGFAERVIRLMSGVAMKVDAATEYEAELRKLAMNFRGHPWAPVLELFVQRETTPDPSLLSQLTARHAVAALPSLSPFVIPSLESRVAKLDYAELVEQTAGRRLATGYAYALSGEPLAFADRNRLTSEHLLLLEAEREIYSENYPAALGIAEHLSASSNAYFRRRAIRIGAFALLRLQRFGECVEMLTTAFAEDVRLYDMIPVKEAVEALGTHEREHLKHTPLLSIAYDLYGTVARPTYDKRVKYAFQDFLAAQSVRRPSELASKVSGIPRAQLLYFLRYIAVEGVMEGAIAYDRTLTFRTSRELVEERVAVCRLLRELDPENENIYEAEILSLLRRLLVRDRLRDVEQRRIYVDLEGVAQSIHGKVEESYNRVAALVRHGFHAEPQEGPQPRRRQRSSEGQLALDLLIPTNEARDLILHIATEMRDEYVSHSAYGLDGYLSLWVRHGALVEQLRSPVEAAHLITKQVSATAEYEYNDHWDWKLGYPGGFVRGQAEECLVQFARQFDELLVSIRDRWVQIKKKDSDPGLLDFRVSDKHTEWMLSMVEEGMPFDDFVGTCVGAFGEWLDASLARIRVALEEDAEVQVDHLLTDLQKCVNAFAEEADLSEFNNSIADARAGVQSAFDRVGEWFYRSVETATEPVAMGDAVRIAAESMRTQSRLIEPEIIEKSNGTPPLIRGSILHGIAAVFAQIFDNVVRRSGFSGPEFHPAVRIDYPEGRIRCRVENPIASSADSPEAHARLDEIRKTIREGKYMSIVRGEGGTGIYKIAKVLTHDIKTPPQLNFGFTEDEMFFVEFELPESLLHHENSDN